MWMEHTSIFPCRKDCHDKTTAAGTWRSFHRRQRDLLIKRDVPCCQNWNSKQSQLLGKAYEHKPNRIRLGVLLKCQHCKNDLVTLDCSGIKKGKKEREYSLRLTMGTRLSGLLWHLTITWSWALKSVVSILSSMPGKTPSSELLPEVVGAPLTALTASDNLETLVATVLCVPLQKVTSGGMSSSYSKSSSLSASLVYLEGGFQLGSTCFSATLSVSTSFLVFCLCWLLFQLLRQWGFCNGVCCQLTLWHLWNL
jgi:hypothetical protein